MVISEAEEEEEGCVVHFFPGKQAEVMNLGPMLPWKLSLQTCKHLCQYAHLGEALMVEVDSDGQEGDERGLFIPAEGTGNVEEWEMVA